MASFACPNCGYPVEVRLRLVKMTTCEGCGTSLFLADDGARMAGDAGVMHDAPLLFGLGDTVRLGRDTCTMHGHARFSYGRGFWDEFWATNASGTPCWVSVDEGDVALQRALDRADLPTVMGGNLRLGSIILSQGTEYRVTEMDEATCVALRGEFESPLSVGEHYRFVNAEAENGEILSAEIEGEDRLWFLGAWHDPFEITVERSGA